MINTWFVSDTHFGHKNIIKFSKRPFIEKSPGDTDDHDECLIDNWNSVVGEKDNVYFLGDFAFRNKDFALSIRKRLKCAQFCFIEGNHDSAAHQIRHSFTWYDSVKMIKIGEQQIWLSHYAHHVWPKMHYGVWHLYGHSHGGLPDCPNAPSMDVGVDATAIRLRRPDLYGTGPDPVAGLNPKDYRPINFDEVAALMKPKKFEPVDHHGKDLA